jgi:MoaA/NifB/PqqE/SkfB family radical SAM enzyme
LNPLDLVGFSGRALRTWFGRLPSPYKLTFSVTERCNLRCRSCNIWRSRRADELSYEEIDHFFAANPSLRWVDLTGGEITLRPDILDITRSAIRHLPHLFQFHFPTNGTRPAEAEAVAATAVSMGVPKVVVSVSMDGPPDLHDAWRGMPGTWASAVETYLRIRDIRRAEVYFGMTLGRDNLSLIFPCLDALARRIPGLTARDLHVNIAHESFYYGSPEIAPLDPPAAADALRRFMQARGFSANPVHLLEMLYQRKVPQYLRSGHSPVPCQALSSSLYLDPGGVVFPCTAFPARLGSIRDTDYALDALWRSPEAVSLTADIRQKRCPGCWTPCEAYQSIIANLPKIATWRVC